MFLFLPETALHLFFLYRNGLLLGEYVAWSNWLHVQGLFWLCGLNWELREDDIYMNPDNADTFLYPESGQTKSLEYLSAEDNPDGHENYLHLKNRSS